MCLPMLLALRCISRDWQHIVDELLSVKGAFLESNKPSVQDVRYALPRGMYLSLTASITVCVSAGLNDAQWIYKQGIAPGDHDDEFSVDDVSYACNRETCTWLIATQKTTPVVLFAHACKTGDLALLQWLDSVYSPITHGMSKEAEENYQHNALFDACTHGHLAVAQWILRIFPGAKIYDNVFWKSCEQGHLAIVQWLKNVVEPSARGNLYFMHQALTLAIIHGHIAVAEWLIEAYDLSSLTATEISVDDILIVACRNGCFDAMKWVTARFEMRAAYTMPTIMCCFVDACCANRVDIAEWLVKDASGHKILTYTLRGCNLVRALVGVCATGYLSTAQWLVETFDLWGLLSEHQLTACFNAACSNGHLAFAQWLLAHIPFHFTDIVCEGAFEAACIEGRLAVAQWLYAIAEDRQLRRDVYTHRAFNMSCSAGHVEIAKWLYTKRWWVIRLDCLPGKRKLREIDLAHLLRKACELGYLDVVAWISCTFKLRVSKKDIDCIEPRRSARQQDVAATKAWLHARNALLV